MLGLLFETFDIFTPTLRNSLSVAPQAYNLNNIFIINISVNKVLESLCLRQEVITHVDIIFDFDLVCVYLVNGVAAVLLTDSKHFPQEFSVGLLKGYNITLYNRVGISPTAADISCTVISVAYATCRSKGNTRYIIAPCKHLLKKHIYI